MAILIAYTISKHKKVAKNNPQQLSPLLGGYRECKKEKEKVIGILK